MTEVYLAIDPGETSGWAYLDAEGKVVDYGQFGKDNITKSLKDLIHSGIKHVIYENYVNFAWKRQKNWSDNFTSKVIGKIEAICELNDIKFTPQPASVKKAGYAWSGLGAAPKDHSMSHQFDAVAHGVYWAQKNGIRKVGLAIKESDK